MFSITSEIPKSPMTTGTNPTPSNNTVSPNVNLSTPVTISTPMKPKSAREKIAEYSRRYYAKNKDRIKARGRKYYITNKDKIRARQKLNYLAARDRPGPRVCSMCKKKKLVAEFSKGSRRCRPCQAEYMRNFYATHPKSRAAQRQWQEANPDRMRAAERKYQAKKK